MHSFSSNILGLPRYRKAVFRDVGVVGYDGESSGAAVTELRTS
jgi:hypothetical protein